MNVHAFVSTYIYQPAQILVGTHFYRASDDLLQIALYVTISSVGIHTAEEKKAAAKAAIEAYATAQGWTLDSIGFDHPVAPTYVSGVKKTDTFDYVSSASVANGVATFNLTDDGTPTGNAVFSEVFTDSPRFLVDDQFMYRFNDISVSADKKTLSVEVWRLAVALGVIVYTGAPNETVVKLVVKGK